MLRDPIERVRIATADVIARIGNQTAMEILQFAIADPNETDTVKLSVIAGLGMSSSPEGLKILAGLLEAGGEFQKETAAALIKRNAKKDIIQLVEIFKDASGDLRGKLVPVFKCQGKDAEEAILELLAEDVATIKPYLARMLEETGYMEETIRSLSHRDVRVRREGARKLSLMGSLPAFRGLVMAAKDPDQEVRVSVVRALEKLKTAEGREILESLKDDPDNRIRKYTHWALERLDSLAME
jgi:HEAT repeat protein